MKHIIVKLLCLLCPVMSIYIILYLFVLPGLIEKTEGPSTEAQIVSSFNNAKSKNYEILIIGNSGLYRGIDPDCFSLSSYNFSHDNDSFNQIYYKLKYLENNNKRFKYIILGVSYFQFSFISDTRNYVYGELLDKEYLKDYDEAYFFDNFLKKYNLLDNSRWIFIKNLFAERKFTSYLKDNGQYVRPGVASANDKYYYSIRRLPVQVKYFELILDFCKRKNIKVFICMLPTRENALINYTEEEMREYDSFISSYTDGNIHYLNYSRQKGWGLSDYTDITHFNENAAKRFSRLLSNDMLDIINDNGGIRPGKEGSSPME